MNHKLTSNQSTVGHRPERLSHPALAAGRIGRAEKPSDNRSRDRSQDRSCGHEGGFSYAARRLLLPLGVSAATGLLSVTALTAAAAGSPDPTAMLPLLSIAALALSSLAGGIAAGLLRRERAVAGSLVSGCLLAAALCIVGLLASQRTVQPLWEQGSVLAWLIRLIPIPVHGIGGFLTRQRPERPAHTAGNHPSHRRG